MASIANPSDAIFASNRFCIEANGSETHHDSMDPIESHLMQSLNRINIDIAAITAKSKHDSLD